MILRFKVIAFICAFLTLTWLMPPDKLLSGLTNAGLPVAETAADKKSAAITAAAERANSAEANMMLEKYELDSSNIVGEDVSKRDKYTKHFRMEDGTFQAVIYGSAVNYQKSDGTWVEVDNTLVQAFDKAGNERYVTKDNGYMNVSFAKDSKSGELVTISKDKYALSWRISRENGIISKSTQDGAISALNINTVTASVEIDLAERKSKLTGNELKRYVDKANSHIKYCNITDTMSLDYYVSAERVKEDITLSSYIPNYSISFDIFTNGLTAKKLDGGKTAFCDGETEVFFLNPSYAMDSKDNDGRVETTLTPIEGGYRLTLTPDDAWMKSASYPVVIDPQIDTDWNPSNIYDTYISDRYPRGINNDNTNGPWYTYASIRFGRNSETHGNCYTLVKYHNLPPLKSSEAIIGAYMHSQRDDSNPLTRTSVVYRLLKDWDQTQVTWNNFIGSDPASAFDSSKIYEAHYVGDAHGPRGCFYTWEITDLVREWYTGESENHGLMMTCINANGLRAFYSSNAKYVDDQVKTIICYVNTAGLEGYWSYQSMDARRAGTASVNLFTGNLVVTRSNIGTSGNRMPVSISHVYNAVYKDDDIGYGKGWRVNYAQTIAAQTIGTSQYYAVTDEDGTIHYFKKDGTKYIDESGQDRKLELDKAIIDLDNQSPGVTYKYTITDKSDNVLCFDTEGRLVKIRDAIGNYISITYLSSNKIATITDGAGRTYTFDYYDTGSGNLKTITAPGNRTVGFEYEDGRLTEVTDPDTMVSTYSYYEEGDLNNTLRELKNFDDYSLSISYNSEDFMFPKVSSVTEYAGTTLGGSQVFEYYEKETKVEDHLGNINIYQFNQYGNTVTIQDDKGRAVYYQFYKPTETTSGGTYGQNKMSLSSRLQEPVINILKNHNMESATHWTFSGGAGGSSGVDSGTKYMGTKSLKLNNSSATGQNNYSQAVPVTKGETYTFSAFVKTSNVQGGSGLGAYLSVGYKNGAGEDQYVDSENLTGTNDWTRMSATVTVPADSVSASVTVYIRLVEQQGTAWFDCAQLENQPVVNRYNMVQNGDMTYVNSSNKPEFWTQGDNNSASDIVVTDNDPNRGKLDNKVFKLGGSFGATKYMEQYIAVSGSAGDSFSFGGWGKANSLPLATKYPLGKYNRRFSIKVQILNNTTVRGEVDVNFNDFSDSWQYLSGRVVATGAYTRVRIVVIYDKNMNSAYFDGIQLFKEEFGQCYDYDAKGNLITVKDLDSNANKVEYDNDNNPKSLQPPDCSDTEKYTNKYYNETGDPAGWKHLLKSSETVEHVKSWYNYDTYGNTITAETRDDLANPTTYIRTQAEYTANGNYIDKSYDARGNYSQYNYSSIYGVNLSTTDPMGQTVSYTYDGDNNAIRMGKLTNVSATVGGTTYSNSYGYTDDLLTTITHNGFDYTIGYNPFGQTTTVSVAGQNLVTNTYITSDRSYLLDYLTYGNGGKVDYAYDDRYRVTGITYDNELSPRYTYAYAANGQLGSVTDTQNGLTTNLYYDLADRPMKTVEKYNSGLRRTFQYKYDMDNCLTEFLELFDTTQYKTALTYDKDNRITAVNYNDQAAGSENVRYSYDVLGRLGTRTLETGATDYVLTYNYLDGGYGTGSTTSMISSIDYNGASSLSYTYDNCGRILSVSDGTNTIQYKYDGLGQLLRTDDPTDTRGGGSGSTWAYAYDAGGNITSKTLYAFCPLDDDLSDNTVVDSFAYTYDNTWKDKLTSYDGNAITYDDIGNPLTYDGWTYTWEAGRQLKSMSDESTTLQFIYNNAGLRTQKIDGSTTTKYYWAGNNISHLTKGSDTLHFYYDAAGLPTMVTYNGSNYYYQHNLQGDIIGLMDMTGSTVVSYIFDSWGKQLSCTGSLASTLGAANPLRYRGYIYDDETGLYYLQSRYYNPEWGRFINCDGQIGGKSGVAANNMFTYCGNNPITRSDSTGKDLYNTIFRIASTIANIIMLQQYKKNLDEYPTLNRKKESPLLYNCFGNAIGKSGVHKPFNYYEGQTTKETFETGVVPVIGNKNIRELSGPNDEVKDDENLVAMRNGPTDFHFIVRDNNVWYNKPGTGLLRTGQSLDKVINIVDNKWKEGNTYYDDEIIYFAIKKDWDAK